MLTFPVDGKGCRLLTCESLARSGIPLGRNLSIVGGCCGAKCNRNSSGQASVFREATTKCGKVATQLFNEALSLKLNRLRIAFERAQRLIELLLTGAEATLRLFVGSDLTLNLNLQRRLCLHALFTLGCSGAGRSGEARLLGELGAEVCDTRLKCATLLSGSGDSSGGTGNGCVATSSRQLPGAQGRSVGFNGGGEVGAAGGELFYAGAPLCCRICGNCLFRGEGDLVQPRLCCGDGSVEPSDALCAFRRASTDRVTTALRLCAGRFSGSERCTGADLGTASLR